MGTRSGWSGASPLPPARRKANSLHFLFLAPAYSRFDDGTMQSSRFASAATAGADWVARNFRDFSTALPSISGSAKGRGPISASATRAALGRWPPAVTRTCPEQPPHNLNDPGSSDARRCSDSGCTHGIDAFRVRVPAFEVPVQMDFEQPEVVLPCNRDIPRLDLGVCHKDQGSLPMWRRRPSQHRQVKANSCRTCAPSVLSRVEQR